MSTAALAIQNQQHRNGRHEVKMIIPVAEVHRLPMWLRTHPSHFSPIYQPRWINNIYFDSEEMASLTEAIEGESRRLKIRLRWYGELSHFDAAMLEFKCKVGSVGWKRSWPMSGPFDLRSQSWRRIVGMISADLPVDRRIIFQQACRPTLINRYWRSYFLSLDQTVRITVDQQLCSWSQSIGRRPNLRHARAVTGHCVIEFKALHEHAERLARVVGELEGRVSKYSKYVAGMVGLTQVDQRW